jgi:hypothetical protein
MQLVEGITNDWWGSAMAIKLNMLLLFCQVEFSKLTS